MTPIASTHMNTAVMRKDPDFTDRVSANNT